MSTAVARSPRQGSRLQLNPDPLEYPPACRKQHSARRKKPGGGRLDQATTPLPVRSLARPQGVRGRQVSNILPTWSCFAGSAAGDPSNQDTARDRAVRRRPTAHPTPSRASIAQHQQFTGRAVLAPGRERGIRPRLLRHPGFVEPFQDRGQPLARWVAGGADPGQAGMGENQAALGFVQT